MSNNIDNKKLIARAFLICLGDIAIAFVSLYVALMLRFNSWSVHEYHNDILLFGIIFTVLIVITYSISGLYQSLWKFASVEELVKLMIASIISIAILFAMNFVLGHRLPISIFPIALMLQAALSGFIRFSYRILRVLKSIYRKKISSDSENRIIVIGGGYEAVATIKSYTEGHSKGHIVALIDRFNNKGSLIHGFKIYGGLDELESAIIEYSANEVIIASAYFSDEDVTLTLDVCAKHACKLNKYNAVDSIHSNSRIVAINTKDLLGRSQVQLDQEELEGFLKHKTILVTGGGGSIGSDLVEQMAKFKPARIVIFDIYENNAYITKLKVERNYPKVEVYIEIGSIQDNHRIYSVFMKYKPDIVFHAAAHKHVPLMEFCPSEALKNNIIGTYNVAKYAHEKKVKKFILISTDKAVNPTNIMGASKRVAEIIVSAFNQHSETKYSSVRFGNVLGSAGSVVPIFTQQIEEGGPIKITHPEIKRYFMTIAEACSLVLQAGELTKGGEIFILDMQKPVMIKDLALNMIKLYGFVPDVDIKIEYTGLRPGEKLFEEIMFDSESIETEHKKIFITKNKEYDIEAVEEFIRQIKKVCNSDLSNKEVGKLLADFVPEYKKPDIDTINTQLMNSLN